MCKEASFVLTKDVAYWSKVTDSHSVIIEEHKLREQFGGKVQLVAVEITPPNGNDFNTPTDKWNYAVDAAFPLPDWYDAKREEQRTRAALTEWIAEKIVLEPIEKIEAGIKLAVYANVRLICGGTVNAVRGGTVNAVRGGTVNAVWGGTVNAVRGGTVNAVWGGTVNEVCGGTVNEVCGGTVNAVRGGTVNAVCGGTVLSYSKTITASLKAVLKGTLAVLIDRSGPVAKCYVGKAEKAKKAKGK